MRRRGFALVPSTVFVPLPQLTVIPTSANALSILANTIGRADVMSYLIQYATGPNGPWSTLIDGPPNQSGVALLILHNGLQPGATVYYRSRVRYGTGRTSDFCNTVVGNTTTSLKGTASVISTASGILTTAAGPGGGGGGGNPTSITSNFGLYAWFDYAGGVDNGRYTNGDKGIIEATAPGDGLTGFGAHQMWRTIDSGSGSAAVYDWSVIDNYIASCAKVGKKLWWRFHEALISQKWSVANGQRVVPTWISNAMGGPQFSQFNYSTVAPGILSKRYNATLVQYWINFLKAFVARYDNNPVMEGFTIYEETAINGDSSGTSVTVATPGADYSNQGCQDQLIRIINAVRDPAQINCKRLACTIGQNYLFAGFDSQARWDQIFQACIANNVGMTGPDSWIEDWTYENIPYTNKNYPQQNANGSKTDPTYNTKKNRGLYTDRIYRGWYGGTDYRGKILWAPDMELTDSGGYVTKNMNPVPTPADIWKVRGPGLDNSHYFFFDVLYGPTGYKAKNSDGTLVSPNQGPAQAWNDSANPTAGVYNWVKTVKPVTNHVSPYK
jgi:hypothetical protein